MKKVDMLVKNGRVTAATIKEVRDLQDALKKSHGLDCEATASQHSFCGWNVRVVK